MTALRIARAIGRAAWRAVRVVWSFLVYAGALALAIVSAHFVIGALEHLTGWAARALDRDEIATTILICTGLLLVGVVFSTKAICDAIRSLRTLNVAGDVNATVRHIDGGAA